MTQETIMGVTEAGPQMISKPLRMHRNLPTKNHSVIDKSHLRKRWIQSPQVTIPDLTFAVVKEENHTRIPKDKKSSGRINEVPDATSKEQTTPLESPIQMPIVSGYKALELTDILAPQSNDSIR